MTLKGVENVTPICLPCQTPELTTFLPPRSCLADCSLSVLQGLPQMISQESLTATSFKNCRFVSTSNWKHNVSDYHLFPFTMTSWNREIHLPTSHIPGKLSPGSSNTFPSTLRCSVCALCLECSPSLHVTLVQTVHVNFSFFILNKSNTLTENL